MKKIALLISVALLASCADMGKQHPNLSPIKTDELNISHRVAAPISPTWWMQLNDATLNRLMETTLKQAPDLDIAAARLRQAQAGSGLAQSQTGVQVAAKATGAGLYHDSLNNKVPAAVDSVIEKDVFYGGANIQAQWTWDLWGKYKSQITAALGRENAAKYEIAQTRLLLAQAVTQAYLQWQTWVEQKSLLQQRLTIKKQQEKIVLARVKAGLMSASQAYPIQAAAQALAALSGQAANALDNTLPEKLRTTPAISNHELTADLLGKRPDIAAQREAVLMRGELIQSAKADFYPNITIRSLIGLSELKIGDLPTSATAVAGLLPSITLPIFTAGALQSHLAQKNAEFDEQVAHYNQSVYRALREAADALSDYDHASAAYKTQLQNVALAQKQAASAQRRVNAGIEMKLAQLNLQDDVLATRLQALNLRLQQSIAWVNTNVAFGGGFAVNKQE